MPSSADVLTFPSATVRARETTVSDRTRAGVERLIALAPVLGRRNPDAVPTVEHVMQNLIGSPPEGGRQREVARAIAANGTTGRARPVKAQLARPAPAHPTRAQQARFTRDRAASAAHNRAIGAWRIADWLEAHPHMSTAVNE